MNITFSPIHGLQDWPMTIVSVAGEVITIDGVDYDTSVIPEGGEGILEDSPFIGPVKRIDGVIHCKILLILGSTAHPYQPTDPEHWIVDVSEDGPVTPPVVYKEGAAP